MAKATQQPRTDRKVRRVNVPGQCKALGMRIASIDEVQQLIDRRIPESPSLEYKEALVLNGDANRRELLKDLTGMANGGGGTLLFGVREEGSKEPVPVEITPLHDAGLPGVVEDIVRAGVRPPLLFQHRVLPTDSGFVWSVDVEPSPLGPYMVESYGTHRYYTRLGSSTGPMSETQVRDAYALALRSRDVRAELWRTYALPLAPLTPKPWVSVSCLPEAPLRDLFRAGSIAPDDVRVEGSLRNHLNFLGLETAANRLGRWADGLFGTDRYDEAAPSCVVRLHGNGAVAIGREIHEKISPFFVARLLNAELAYAAWFWQRFELQRAVEIRVRVDNLAGTTFEFGDWMFGDQTVNEPPDVPVHFVENQEEVHPWSMADARERHGVVQRLVDRLYQAFGQPHAVPMFSAGQLHSNLGPQNLAIAGGGVFDDQGVMRCRIFDDGTIRSADAAVVAFVSSGVVTDLDGHTLAALELSTGAGCPPDFLPQSVVVDPRARVHGSAGAPVPADPATQPPSPTRTWASKTLREQLGLV